jgi:hypothetical protein
VFSAGTILLFVRKDVILSFARMAMVCFPFLSIIIEELRGLLLVFFVYKMTLCCFHSCAIPFDSDRNCNSTVGIYKSGSTCIYDLYSYHNTSILIPIQQRILSTLSLCILNVRPPPHKILMRKRPRQLSCYGAIHIFHDFEVCREEDIEVPLLDLQLN